jgi:hypothetical protein
VAGLARDRAHLDDAVIYLGNLHLEKQPHEVRLRAREDDLGAALVLGDFDHAKFHALAEPVHVAGGLLLGRNDSFGSAEIDDDGAAGLLLDGAGDDIALAFFEFGEDVLLLGLFDFLNNDLLGGLGGDAAEGPRGDLGPNYITLFGFLIDGLRFFERYFRLVVLDFLDDLFYLVDADVPSLLVEIYLDVAIVVEALFAVSMAERIASMSTSLSMLRSFCNCSKIGIKSAFI